MGILTDDEDMKDLINMIESRRARKIFRQRENQKWNDQDVITRYWLSKNEVRFLLENTEEQISFVTDRLVNIKVFFSKLKFLSEDQVFVTLLFLATGLLLQVVGDFIGT